jgi:hypothetical protein
MIFFIEPRYLAVLPRLSIRLLASFADAGEVKRSLLSQALAFQT